MSSVTTDSKGASYQTYNEYNLPYTIGAVKSIEIEEEDNYARMGLISFLSFLHRKAVDCDAQYPGVLKKANAFIMNTLNKYTQPTIDITKFELAIPYNLNISTLSLFSKIGHDTLHHQLMDIYNVIFLGKHSLYDFIFQFSKKFNLKFPNSIFVKIITFKNFESMYKIHCTKFQFK